MALLVLSAWLPSSTLAAGTARPDRVIEAQCRHYFRTAVCSEALGRWLPGVPIETEPTAAKTPTRVFDGFGGVAGTTARAFKAYAPAGTAFVHGDAGPPRGTVVYDRRHRIAFYGEGCCSYFTVVLAAQVAPPPVAVASRDLAAVRTNSGLRLGDSSARVTSIYGSAPLQRIPSRPHMMFLFYENGHPAKPGPCLQDQVFGFTGNRLSIIEITNGC